MRRSTAAVAIISRVTPTGEAAWLAQWNAKWGRLNLVAGHKRPHESFRDCCAREVAEELGLEAGRDFAVADAPLARVGYDGYSASAREETRYEFELFAVTLATPAALERVSAQPENGWLTAGELYAGRAADGRPVSPTAFRLLNGAGLLVPAAGEVPFDLFVSYAHADNADGWVAGFVDALRREFARFSSRRPRVFFDADAVGTGDDWAFRLNVGVRQSKLFLAVLSPAYFASDWCGREREAYLDLELARARPGEAVAPVYAVPAPAYEAGGPTRSNWVADFRPFYPHGLDAIKGSRSGG